MMENICSQGHVIDFGKDICSRCNGRAIGMTGNPPVIVEESEEMELEAMEDAKADFEAEEAPKKKKKSLIEKVFKKKK